MNRRSIKILTAFFLVAAFFLGAAFFLVAAGLLFLEAAALVAALSLKDPLFLVSSPSATALFKAFKYMPFIHFLSLGRLACMCFLIAMEEDPVRSLSAEMASKIPALYDMLLVVVESCCLCGVTTKKIMMLVRDRCTDGRI